MQFLQSIRDFPQMVTLGDKMPSFGLHRYRQGLRFVPVDDEGFTLRGDKQRLVYKGRRRSHRFTILGDSSFEYDCILNKEPDSNVILMRIEGSENFDFFRQPDFVSEPFLKGSYAVYKKETFIGEGTGKLCHIHRPEIIDARGRRCWGTLEVNGDELQITIPEKWLSEAKYPVIVDPTVGTTTVGAFSNIPNPAFQVYTVYFSREFGLEQYILPANFRGQANAYYYSNDNKNINNVTPVMYSNNNNLPNIKLSSNEAKIVKNPSILIPGWRSSVFDVNTLLVSGSAVWFGLYAETFFPLCDYGGSLVTVRSLNREIYDDFPINEIFNTEPRYGLKLSMYFTYEESNNYITRLVQGVTLNDTKRINIDYKRTVLQYVNGMAVTHTLASYFRKCVLTVGNSMTVNKLSMFVRNAFENIKVTAVNSESRGITRNCNESVTVGSMTSSIRGIICKIHNEILTVNSELTRIRGVICKLKDVFSGNDNQSFTMLYVRYLPDNVQVSHIFRQCRMFFRGIWDNAGSTGEIRRKAGYYRRNADTVRAAGVVFRKMFLFVKIVSNIFIRDYILARFLKAKTELTIKSCVVREIWIESRIN